MREALAARSDHDFIAEPAPRRTKPRARGKPLPESRAAQVMDFVRRYPLEMVISVALFAAGSAIVWNALALQTARHPAPWFGRRNDPPAPLPPSRPAIVPAPAPAPPAAAPTAPIPVAPRAARDTIGDLLRTGEPIPMPVAQAPRPALVPPAPPARPNAAPAPAAPAVVASAPAQRDAIGDLIRLGDAPPVPPGLVGRPEVIRLVASAQRALSKLNYLSTKPDGVMGPGTKQAIERFERDRKLPVTGELGSRTARELAAASGIPVE